MFDVFVIWAFCTVLVFMYLVRLVTFVVFLLSVSLSHY